ncbi:uncharacterized protein LOC144098776 [Amblyomma americanum]
MILDKELNVALRAAGTSQPASGGQWESHQPQTSPSSSGTRSGASPLPSEKEALTTTTTTTTARDAWAPRSACAGMQTAGRSCQPSPQRQACEARHWLGPHASSPVWCRLRRQRPRLPSLRHGGRVPAPRRVSGSGGAAAPASRIHCVLLSSASPHASRT